MGVTQPSTDDKIADIRRSNLLALINARFNGNRAAFAKASGKNANMINLVLTSNPGHRRTVGERMARSIEAAIGLTPGSLDIVTTDDALGAVYSLPVVRLDKLDAVTSERITLGADVLMRHLNKPSAVSAVRAVYMPSSEMEPAISQDDLMLVDTGATVIDRDGVYVITRGKDVFVRRVTRLLTGGVKVSSDASPEAAVTVEPDQFHCAGRLVGLLRFRPA